MYRVLVSLCRNCPENQEYAFQLVAFFQIHCKYIPEAIAACIEMFCLNERILTALSLDLHIDYDYSQTTDPSHLEQQHSHVIKFLINLYDEDPQSTAGPASASGHPQKSLMASSVSSWVGWLGGWFEWLGGKEWSGKEWRG